MKDKHLQIRIDQCLALARASGCPRRKLAALLLDPIRNVILADGYNGGPREAKGSLCKGVWCERDGLTPENVTIGEGWRRSREGYHTLQTHELQVRINGERVWGFDLSDFPGVRERVQGYAEKHRNELLEKYPPVKSGENVERGCHHAEMNVICNAAAGGVKTAGAWMIILAEPCVMCAKLIHHSGITKVIVVDGGYIGGKEGVNYLQEYGVKVQTIQGPRDPREISQAS